MRADMSKVIVERPRRGSWQRNRKSALALDPSRAEDDAYIDPPRRGSSDYSRGKHLNENLAPLRRYLERSVGRPWAKVYSEICATLDSRKATGLHILQHLMDFVTTNTWLEGKQVIGQWRWGRAEPVRGLYVHPVSKLLRRAPDPRPRWSPPPPREIRLGELTIFRLVGATWYRCEYAAHEPNEVAEVVRFHEDKPERNQEHGLKAPGDRRIIRYRDLPLDKARYEVRRRQCTREELAEIERMVAASR